MVNKDIQEVGNSIVISFSGKIEASLGEDFEKDILGTLESYPDKNFIVDLSSVPSITSSFLRILFEMKKVLESRGRKLKLSGINPSVERVLEITDTKDEFEIYPTKEDAIKG